MIEAKLSVIGNRVLESKRFAPGASVETMPEWSSLKHIVLLGEIANEFGIDVELEDAYRLDSFETLTSYIQERLQRDGTAAVNCGRIEYEVASIGQLLASRTQRQPEATFLIFPKEDKSYSYHTLYGLASAAALRLQADGLRKGDRLCLAYPNAPEFLVYYFAAHLLGVVVVPINPALTATEMAYIIGNSGAKLTMFDNKLAGMLEQLAAAGLTSRWTVTSSESEYGLDALRPAAQSAWLAPDAEVGLDDVAVILYTSGTTGNPKGVALSNRNFLADSKALADWFQFAQGTRTLCILPMFHNNGQVITLLSPLWVGGSTVIVEGKSALMSFWKMIDAYSVQWTSVMPAFLSAFLEYKLKRYDSSLRGIVCGGQVLLDEVRARFESEYRVQVFEGYGLTETTSFSCINRYPAELRKFGSIGYPLLTNDMKIVNDEGQEAPVGETGEILIRGDNVARSYHELPEVSAQRFKDRWLHSGDYGYRDAEGNFYFGTRLDDLIIKGGENIYPTELENVLHTCDEVVECAAFGIPDKILGHDICVYVKLQENSKFDEADIREYLRDRIAGFKQPKHAVILNRLSDMTELPKGPTKKILRRKLREHFLLAAESMKDLTTTLMTGEKV